MWQNFYEQFVEKLQTLADDFGRSLQDFINGLEFARALSWEASLHRFLHDWRQRGILVDEKQCGKLFQLLGELREKYVPADELRAAQESWQRHAKDRLDHPGPMQLGEPSSPVEALLPGGLRELGHGIMRRHASERWLFVADDVLSSWRFAEGLGETFRAWMAAEQRAQFAAADDLANTAAATDSSASGGNVTQDQSGPAPESAEPASPSESTASKAGGVAAPNSGDESADDLPYVNFDTYMESEGILYYEVNSQWWKVPVKKVTYHDDEVYDLRGAVKIEPTFIQRMLLGNDGWIEDDGWEVILRHYQDSYGPSGHKQLLKDLASRGVGEAFSKFTAEQAPELILGLLFGEAAARIEKIASPALRKSYAALQKRLKALSKQSKKQTKAFLEKELSEVADELRELSKRETDAVAKREAKEIADGLEDEYKKGSEKLQETARKENPRKRVPRTDGRWEGQPGNGVWYSDNPKLNAITSGKPIKFANGRAQLSEWAKETLKFKPGQLNGGRADRGLIYDRIAKDKKLPNRQAAQDYLTREELTPHHADNTTIELVPTALHKNLPHIGSASDLRGGFE
jgi:hypothetical protein